MDEGCLLPLFPSLQPRDTTLKSTNDPLANILIQNHQITVIDSTTIGKIPKTRIKDTSFQISRHSILEHYRYHEYDK